MRTIPDYQVEYAQAIYTLYHFLHDITLDTPHNLIFRYIESKNQNDSYTISV